MERWILILCHDRPQLADLQGEWQKKGISVRIVSVAGEASSIAYSKFMWKIISQAHPFCMSNDILPDVR